MNRIGIFFIGAAFLIAAPSMSTAQQAQTDPPPTSSQEMRSGSEKEAEAAGEMKMGSGMMQEMPCMQMMQKMMPRMMAEKASEKAQKPTEPETGLSFFMAPFHRWMNLLMAHREVLELSPEQVDRLDAAVTGHLKTAVRGQAEIQALMIDLKHSLRSENLNLQAAEDLLKRISDQQLTLHVEGLRLYENIINTVLTEAQKTKTKELIGGPFPPPWQDMPSLTSPHSKEEDGSRSEGSKTEGKAQEEHH